MVEGGKRRKEGGGRRVVDVSQEVTETKDAAVMPLAHKE